MSSSKIRVCLGVLAASWGLIELAATPVMAEENEVDRNLPNHVERRSRSPIEISTQADDLLQPSQRQHLLENSLRINRLAQKLDLETFCQDYPDNSRCAEVTPVEEPAIERSPVPIPAPPPPSTINAGNDERQRSGWAIVPEVSTLGLGGQVVRKITPALNARIGVNALGFGLDIEETEFDYDGDLNLFNVSTLVDVHPFKSGFRISGGLIFNDNNIEGTANISEQVIDDLGEAEVLGQTIDVSNLVRELNIDSLVELDADIDITNSVAPYLGIGGGNAVGNKGLGFWWNLGVVFGGSPDAEVTSNVSDDVPEIIRDRVEAVANEILEEEEQDLEDELDFINIYPVVSLGFSYQF